MKISPQWVAHDIVTQTLMNDMERYRLFPPGMPTNPESSSPFILADDHKGLVLRWDPMRAVLPKPTSSGMPIYIFSVRLSSKPVQRIFQQLHLPKHWLSLLCTHWLLIFILLIYKCCTQRLSSFSWNSWIYLGWLLSLALSLFHVSFFCLPKPDCEFLERGASKNRQHLIQTDRRKNIWTERPLLFLVIQKICLNLFRTL